MSLTKAAMLFNSDRRSGHSRSFQNEKGFVLVIALLALLLVTIIGVLAISTSTTEIMIAGNTRIREMNFAGAESGLEISDPVIRFITFHSDLGDYEAVVSDRGLDKELRIGRPFEPADTCIKDPDLSLNLGSKSVTVDIDRMFSTQCEGVATEYASGYEGVGIGGSGNICAYYVVNSISRSALGSESAVRGFYRYVSY
ncbi:MAG: PilX N-terminal domain-containing pilus assembly protein [Thermodesulfovibrionales bacterium]